MPDSPSSDSGDATLTHWILGVDTGGTFTDFVLLKRDAPDQPLRIHKVLSTPDSPERAILQGITELGLTEAVHRGEVTLIHGSTVATNAALEGKGVKTALITNEGFRDLLTIGRQTRRELYNLQPAPILPPVPRELCFEIRGRVNADGQLLDSPTRDDLQTLHEHLKQADVEAVAINLLFSWLNPQPEQQVKAALDTDWFSTASHEVLPESGEYERGIATWLNASLGPKVKHYLQRLQQGVQPSPLSVMQSTGGVMDATLAGERAVNMLLSGPAGGLAAAEFLAKQTGFHKLLTFDMGGTSTDVSLVDGKVQLTNESHIGPWPVAVPQVDMHTIGAGGGSYAFVDAGGMLQVGPESAGANPGPACYGQGGTRPTVTDANVILGRLQAKYFLGGNMDLDLTAAEQAIDSIATPLGMTREETAAGIIRIANEHMVRALRVISIERGHALDDFHLCCFGGAGGLHVCALAESLELKRAIVPNQGGVLSALGMVVAPVSRQLSQAHQCLLLSVRSSDLKAILRTLEAQGRAELVEESQTAQPIQCEFQADLRYAGQRFYLNLTWQDDLNQLQEAFHQTHESRYGHRLAMPVELVNLRCSLTAPSAVSALPGWPEPQQSAAKDEANLAGIEQPVPVYWRPDLARSQLIEGPALIAETVSTTFIAPGWFGSLDEWGNLLLKCR